MRFGGEDAAGGGDGGDWDGGEVAMTVFLTAMLPVQGMMSEAEHRDYQTDRAAAGLRPSGLPTRPVPSLAVPSRPVMPRRVAVERLTRCRATWALSLPTTAWGRVPTPTPCHLSSASSRARVAARQAFDSSL